MSKEKFKKLCDQVRPFVEKRVTNVRKPISVKKQVAITLYYFADEGRYRKVANAFGISRSSVFLIAGKVSFIITYHLGPKYVMLPWSEEEVKSSGSISAKNMGSHNALGLLMRHKYSLNDHLKTQLTF